MALLLRSLPALLWTQLAHAQSGPEVHLEGIGGQAVESANGVSAEARDTRLSVLSAGASSPLPPLRLLADRWVVVPRMNFEFTRLRFEGERLPSAEDRDLYTVGLGALNLVPLTGRWTAVVLVQPGLFTDFDGPLSGDDVGVSALALGSWTASEALSLGAGAGYVWFFGRPRWTPFGQLKLDRERVAIDVLLPRTATAWWKVAGPLWLGAEAEIDGGFFRLHPEPGDLVEAVFQEYSRSRAGMGARLKARDKVVFELTGSVIPQTRATVYLDADTALFDFALSPGWSVAGQISLEPGE